MSPPAVVPGVAVARQSDRQDAGPWARRLATGRSLTTLQVGLALTQHEMLSFAILAGVGIVLQSRPHPSSRFNSIRVDLMFILAFTTRCEGPAGGGHRGVDPGPDRGSGKPGPARVHAFFFGLAAWVIVRFGKSCSGITRSRRCDHAGVHHAHSDPGFAVPRRGRPGRGRQHLWPAFLTGVYTAACAPYLHWPAHPDGRWTG